MKKSINYERLRLYSFLYIIIPYKSRCELLNGNSIQRFKISIFGDGGVGKTTLINRYLKGVFNNSTKITIGIDFYVKKLEIEDIECSLQIWDFAGESEFRSLFPSFVKNSDGGIFMFDITRYTSLENFDDWLYVFKNHNRENKEIPVLLVGGKSDLEDHRVVVKNDVLDLAQAYGDFEYIECSSKTGDNVEDVFTLLTRNILKNKGLI